MRLERTASADVGADLLRKPVNTLAIVPKSARITMLGRKSYNVLLFEAQEQGLENELFRAPLERIIRGIDFDSHDHALIKKHLRAMVSTTVEWQSPTPGEGSSWNVSGLLAHARLSKEHGQVWVEWSYAVNLKQELLEPTVFARLKLEVISQLRSHAGVALYEICTRYKEVGRTSRQAWRWWHPVLSGNPATDKTARLEYRIFKRDTLKPAIAEVNAITDLQVELLEHRQGRFIDEIQFRIQAKRQTALPLTPRPAAVDLRLVARARELGIDDEVAEALVREHGEAVVERGLDALGRRCASAYPEPLRDAARYLRALLGNDAKARAQALAEVGGTGAVMAAESLPQSGWPASEKPLRPALRRAARSATVAVGARVGESGSDIALAPQTSSLATHELHARRHARWRSEWLRRRREHCADEIAALDIERQNGLVDALLADMQHRGVHPSLRKRLQTSGWQHPMVRHEMLRFYAVGAYGDDWDRPRAEQLLEIAAELGEDADPRHPDAGPR